MSAVRFLFYSTKRVLELRPDVVHLHSTIAGLLRAVPTRSRKVYTPHCYASERSDLPRAVRKLIALMESALAQRAVIAGVSAHECRLASDEMKAAHVVFLPNTSSVRNVSADQKPIIATVGRVTAQKDPSLFATIAREFRDSNTQFVWIGGGDSAYTAELEQAGVAVTGWLEHEQAMSVLATSMAYVHTAEWEGTPLALLEAAALGKPILARKIPAFSGLPVKLIDGEPALFAEEIRLLAQDSEIRRTAIERSRELADMHSERAQRDALASLYA